MLRTIGILTLSANLISLNAISQVEMYMSELINKRYMCIIDKESGEFRTYRFIDEDKDGWASGVQEQYMPVTDPEGMKINAPVYDQILAFEIETSDQCGNCMIFKMEDDSRKYFTVDHDAGDFWINETDESFSKFDEKKIYRPFIMDQDKANGEREIYAESNSEERYWEWTEKLGEDSWVAPGFTLATSSLISVTTVLPEDENFDYIGENALDDNPYTTWFSDPASNADYPANEDITFTMEVKNETIWILNGMQYSTEDFENNSRVKTFIVFVNGEKFGTVELLDMMGPQKIVLEGISEYQVDNASVEIKLVISDIFPGKEYNEAGITEIYSYE
ncbi:MAG: hypothetical protein JNJ99_02250 [Crocinitomicaceae bacterium]|nr:hypothetical protein [Crocinitomicaceae bacterium]